MKTINMANGAVMGMVDPPRMDSCPSCALAKAQCLPSKTSHIWGLVGTHWGTHWGDTSVLPFDGPCPNPVGLSTGAWPAVL